MSKPAKKQTKIYRGELHLKLIPQPRIPLQVEKIRQKHLRRIQSDPNLHNGQKLFCYRFRSGHALVYQADYALRLAMQEIGTPDSLGIGPLWCAAQLQNPAGEFLLSQRAKHLPVEPGKWFTSAAGGIEFGEGPQDAATRELLEETGISASLSYAGAVIGKYPYGLGMIYQGKVQTDLKVELDPEELTQWGWFSKNNIPNPSAELLPEILNLV